MIINKTNLQTLGVGFQARFQGALGQAASQHAIVATIVRSTTGKEEYGWLGKLPGIREWIGDRVINNIKAHDYSIKNKDFEETIAVDRNDIEDDNLGMYGPLFEELGRAAGAFPDELVYNLLKAGFASPCYDGQYFFDTDHPVLDAAGNPQSVSNTQGGAGVPWFLIDDSRGLKPIILQMRKDFTFVSKTAATDDNVFHAKQYLYGVDGRMAVGFGFWQFAQGSKQDLTVANYKDAYAALEGMKGDFGRPLGLRPTKLVVPPSLREQGQRILKSANDAAGATNPWAGTAELVVVPWLA